MILFKRVRESFRRIEGREWALLGLETVGIVGGILIAFELNEWASRRAAAQKQHELLDRLFDESEATVSFLRRDRDHMDHIVKAETAFATALVHQQTCPPEPMWQAVDTLPIYPSVAPPSSVYQEIVGSGGLSTIADSNVRHSVGYFHSQLESFQGQNAYFRGRLDYPISIATPSVTYDFDVSKEEPQVSHYDRSALCADHTFRNGIADNVRSHMLIAAYHDELARAAVAMCASIGAAIGKSCSPDDGPLTGPDAKAAEDALSRRAARKP
jgi:hypothetical protein